MFAVITIPQYREDYLFMIILDLKTKTCMGQLLLNSTFDRFSLIEGEVTTFNRFHVDGHLHKEFYEDAPEAEYSSWGELREYFYQVIRGKRTPLSFKFILSLGREEFASFLAQYDISFRPEDIQGLYLNLRFDGSSLQCVTGTSMNIFTMDKSLEKAWDEYTQQFFSSCGIEYEMKL